MTGLAEQFRRRFPALADDDLVGLTLHVVAITYLAAHVFLATWVVVPVLVTGLQPVVVDGGSMAPTLARGDIVLLADDRPVVGSVATYEDGAGRLVTHRVIGIEEDGSLVTQGDANPDRDGATVPVERVLGVGELAVPFAGLPATWLRSGRVPLALWLAATTGAALVANRTRASVAPVAAGHTTPDPAARRPDEPVGVGPVGGSAVDPRTVDGPVADGQVTGGQAVTREATRPLAHAAAEGPEGTDDDAWRWPGEADGP